MRPAREITPEDEHFRMERRGPFEVIMRDGVEPEPVGTIVLKAFRVTGYDSDCDGSLMARLDQIDRDGEWTGWSPDKLGLSPDDTLVVSPEEWRGLFEPPVTEP